jgi:hypothetical protein
LLLKMRTTTRTERRRTRRMQKGKKRKRNTHRMTQRKRKKQPTRLPCPQHCSSWRGWATVAAVLEAVPNGAAAEWAAALIHPGLVAPTSLRLLEDSGLDSASTAWLQRALVVQLA